MTIQISVTTCSSAFHFAFGYTFVSCSTFCIKQLNTNNLSMIYCIIYNFTFAIYTLVFCMTLSYELCEPLSGLTDDLDISCVGDEDAEDPVSMVTTSNS